MFESFNDFMNEKMVSPKRGHNYFIVTKPVEIAYITGHYGMGMEVPGVLLKNKDGYFQGKKGAYIIDYFGAMYYVDMEEKLAIKISDMASQKELHNAIKPVNKAPEHADWKDFLNESTVNETNITFTVDQLHGLHQILVLNMDQKNKVGGIFGYTLNTMLSDYKERAEAKRGSASIKVSDRMAQAMDQLLDNNDGILSSDDEGYIRTKISKLVGESVNEGRSINKIKKDYDKVINDMAETVTNWKAAKESGDDKAEANFLARLKELTAKKKALMSELDDAVGLKDLGAELAESLITEGMFSFKTLGDNKPISARNGADIYMFDDKGNMWHEENYEGYGIFGGKDFFELMAEMNGEEGRDAGIDLYFSGKRGVLYPALTRDENFKWKRHKFTTKIKDDPSQGMSESLVNEGIKKGDIKVGRGFKIGGDVFRIIQIEKDRRFGPIANTERIDDVTGKKYTYRDTVEDLVAFFNEEGAVAEGMELEATESINESLNERVVTIKRRYTENYPALTAGKSARVRNKMLEAIADGKITQEEFDAILREMSTDTKRWSKRNAKYFNVSEDGISLSKFGRRILNQIAVNEAETMINERRENWIVYTGEIQKKFYSEHTSRKSAEKMVDMAMRVLNQVGMMPKSLWEKEKEEGYVMEDKVFLYESFAAFESAVNEDFSDVSDKFKEALDNLPDSKFNTKDIEALIKKYREKRPDAAMAYAKKAFGWLFKESADVNESSFVVWYEDKEGKHLLGTFHNKRAAEKYKSEEEDEVLNHVGVSAIGTMSKKMWDKNEAPYIKESVNESDAWEDLKDMIETLDDKQYKKYAKQQGFDPKRKNAESMWNWVDSLSGKDAWEAQREIEKEILESVDLNEAFASSKLRNLLSMGGSDGRAIKDFSKAFYGLTKYKLDELPDASLRDLDVKTAYREYQKDNEFVVFYIVDSEKENPYADEGSWDLAKVKPGILAITRGKDFIGSNSWNNKLSKGTSLDRGGSPAGGDKRYSGYGASGLYNIKRVADVADRAIVVWLNNEAFKSTDKTEQRADAKSGAIAFMSDKDFKKANMARYKEILASNAAKLPLDKIVEGAINELTKQIAVALKDNNVDKFGGVIIGMNPKGREVSIKDAGQHMSNILDDYSRYSSYMKNADEERASGYSSGFYEKEAKEYAKRIADRVKKIKKMDYAW